MAPGSRSRSIASGSGVARSPPWQIEREFRAVLPAALTQGQGLRTTSTSAQFGTIPNISKDTTTGLSRLYGVTYKVYLPMVKK